MYESPLQSGQFSASTIIVNDDAPAERLVVNNPAFDLIGLTGLRNDPRYSEIDGERPLVNGENIDNYKNFSVAVLDSGVEGAHDKLKDNFVGYAFQIEMKFKAWINGFNLIEESIVFLNRAHGNSKMDSSIILEAFFGVLYLKANKKKNK